MKKAIALLLTLVMVMSMLAACGGGSDASAAKDGAEEGKAVVSTEPKVLNVGIPSDIASLGPYIGSNQGQLYTLYGTVYQYLFYRNEFAEGETHPMLGESYTESDGGLTVTVKLFENIKDSAGNAITAEDVVFSYETAEATGLYNKTFSMLDSVEALDEYTVEFKFNSTKLGNTIDQMCVVPVVDSEAYDDAAFLTAPIATGPYVVKEYVAGSYLTLEKNENYWQTDASQNHLDSSMNADTITFKVILETAQMAIALETGDIDMAAKIAYNEISFFTDKDGNTLDGYYIESYPSHLNTNLTFNLSGDSVLSDNLALRQAIAYAINNEELVQGVLNGAGSTISSWGTSVYADYNPKWDQEDYYDYNVEMAKQKLAEAGYKEGDVTVRLIFENNANRKKAAELIQAYLLEVGINTEICAYDAALYSNYRSDFSQWDLLLDNQANSTAMASMWSTFASYKYTVYNDVPVNIAGLHSDELEELVNRAVALDGHTEQDVDNLHYWMKDNVMIYGLWAEDVYMVAQDGVTDLATNSKLYAQANRCILADDYASNES